MRAGYHLLHRRNQHLNFPATTALKISIRALPPHSALAITSPTFSKRSTLQLLTQRGPVVLFRK